MVRKVYSSDLFSGQTKPVFLIVAVAAGLAGACSADVSRFNFNDSPTTGALPATPAEPVYGNRSGLGKTATQRPFDTAERTSEVRPSQDYGRANPSPYNTNNTTPTLAPQRPAQSAQVPPVAYAPPQQTPEILNSTRPSASQAMQERGRMIVVRRGDTLYGLSRRHGVGLTALMNVNNLRSSAIKPGQKLYLPAGANSVAQPQSAPARNEPIVAATAPAHWTDSYTIQPGDSLYALSRRYNVKIADLKRYNNIRNPRLLRPGVVLRVPGPGGDNGTFAARAPANEIAQRKVRSRPIAGSPTILNSSRRPSTLSQETQVAAVNNTITATDAGRHTGQSVTVRPDSTTRNSIAGSSKLRWPVRGRVVSAFGKRNDGTHNDGINVAVPLGTNIHAAEGGMVAYAGNELKGYGNLVLVRHDNGWVTAYAHAEKLLVKRGDRVRRGDVIAKAGKTGDVAQPQVHFEVRQGQKPVDPVPFMERL